jgi:hypothetical protein
MDNNKSLKKNLKIHKGLPDLVPIDDLLRNVKSLPKENFYFEGIKENSLNLLVAQSKVGKTTMAENLATCIAAGYDNYLGKRVWSGENKKVLIINLEEFYVARTGRNAKQIAYMDTLIGNTEWHKNLITSPVDSPRYINTNKQWQWLSDQIEKYETPFVCLDSLSRMHGSESIEDSSTSIRLMEKVKKIQEKTKTTILIVHHTNKLSNEPISMSDMAGSRILSQEADAIIALNKTPSGKRYFKPICYRYSDDSGEMVLLFERNEHQWLIPKGEVKEYKILKEFDYRVNDSNSKSILNHIIAATGGDRSIIVTTKELTEAFVKTKIISGVTLHTALKKLEKDGEIVRAGTAKYTL